MADFVSYRDRIVSGIREVLRRRYGADPPVQALPTPSAAMGDLGVPVAFALAKELRRKPREIAEELAPAVLEIEGVSRVEVAGGGYLNVFLRRGEFLRELWEETRPGPRRAPAGGKVVVEHTNINPNKAAHIGHLRNAVLGDTLVRLLRQADRRVEVQNYIDDTGVQVADAVVGFEVLEKKGIEEVRAIPDLDRYCWDLYARVGEWYEEDASRLEHRRRTLRAMEEGGGPTAELGAHIAERIVRHHLATMARVGVRYDLLPRESDILRLGFWEAAFEEMRITGAVRKEEGGKNAGCWVMDLATPEFEGLEESEKVLVRSDGTVTYVGKDIAYQMWKLGLLGRDFRYVPFLEEPDGKVVWRTASEGGDPEAPRFGRAERVYNVIDQRQAYLQKIVRAALRILGHEREAEGSVHYGYEHVSLSRRAAEALGLAVAPEDEAKALGMSGRKGIGVKADDLLDLLGERARAEVAERNPALPVALVVETGHRIAVAALRYFLLKYTRGKGIVFDFDEALQFEGETGPYLQYSAVRARNIFARLAEAGRWESGQAARHVPSSAFALLEHPETGDDVWGFVRLAGQLGEAVEQSLGAEEPATLARYAFNLAQGFSSFYHKYPLLKEQDDALMADRAVIVEVFLWQMERALGLLGIELPERM